MSGSSLQRYCAKRLKPTDRVRHQERLIAALGPNLPADQVRLVGFMAAVLDLQYVTICEKFEEMLGVLKEMYSRRQ